MRGSDWIALRADAVQDIRRQVIERLSDLRTEPRTKMMSPEFSRTRDIVRVKSEPPNVSDMHGKASLPQEVLSR
jgi:hypothetical protein